MQLDQSRITIMLPVEDPARAAHFYEDVVGLAHAQRMSDGRPLFSMPHGEIVLVEDKEHIDHDHTAFSFEVSNLNEAMTDLKGRGVKFEDYDLEGLRTVEGVVAQGDVRMAWFKDTEGNVICVHERLRDGPEA